MQTAAAKQILTQKEPARLYDVVEPVLQDTALRQFLVEGSFDKSEVLRYNCVRVLFRALDRDPLPFYPYWDRFEKMIDSPNGFYRSSAAQAIAYLAAVDVDCRIDGLLKHYLRLLGDPKVMVAHYFVQTLGRLCRARPDLQDKVLKSLLSIDSTAHTQQHKDLLKADILSVIDALFGLLSPAYQKKAMHFAEAASACTSPKTRKAAKAFLTARSA